MTRLLLVKAEPTQAQLDAGNYRKERITFAGLPITIENPKGSVRRGRDRGGKAWSITMQHPYGYIRRSLGVDGDAFDCYLGPDESAPNVYVVTTMAPPTFSKTDEQKAMVGFRSAEAAKAAYLAHYDNPRFFGSMVTMPLAKFKAELATTRDKPRFLKALLLLPA